MKKLAVTINCLCGILSDYGCGGIFMVNNWKLCYSPCFIVIDGNLKKNMLKAGQEMGMQNCGNPAFILNSLIRWQILNFESSIFPLPSILKLGAFFQSQGSTHLGAMHL